MDLFTAFQYTEFRRAAREIARVLKPAGLVLVRRKTLASLPRQTNREGMQSASLRTWNSSGAMAGESRHASPRRFVAFAEQTIVLR